MAAQSRKGGTVIGAIVGFVLLSFAVSGGIGAAIGASKGRAGLGFALGAFLGFIGWIIIAVMEPSPQERLRRTQEFARAVHGSPGDTSGGPGAGERACPWCAETVKTAALLCRFCGRDLPPWEAPVALPPRSRLRDKDNYAFLSQEFPRSFDAVWDTAILLGDWPKLPTPALRRACGLVEAGHSPDAAVVEAFA
jgi:hypothetical protein